MRFCLIACEVLTRECARAAAYSPHVVDTYIIPFGLHSEPDELRSRLQQEIDQTSADKYDYVLLAYGLCSRGTADLRAGEVPLVIPRAHDCITLLLGSMRRYEEEFGRNPGTYYYSAGWVERSEGEVRQGVLDPVKERQMEERYLDYVEKYGQENALYLIEQERLWFANYNRAVLINTGVGDIEEYRRFTSRLAAERGWSYEETAGESRLIDALLNGQWTEEEFLVVKPGQRTVEQVNRGIIAAVE